MLIWLIFILSYHYMDNTTGALMEQAFLILLENTISYTVSYRGDTGIYGVTEKNSYRARRQPCPDTKFVQALHIFPYPSCNWLYNEFIPAMKFPSIHSLTLCKWLTNLSVPVGGLELFFYFFISSGWKK